MVCTLLVVFFSFFSQHTLMQSEIIATYWDASWKLKQQQNCWRECALHSTGFICHHSNVMPIQRMILHTLIQNEIFCAMTAGDKENIFIFEWHCIADSQRSKCNNKLKKPKKKQQHLITPCGRGRGLVFSNFFSPSN